jgi:diacylglycerol kinase family enzyme
MVWRMYRQRYAGDDRMLYLQARDIVIHSDPPVFTETDGEPLGETPLHVRSVAGGIDVLVPAM